MKSKLKYVFIFAFSLICMSFLLTAFDLDVIWNYGFSYGIARGEIPYKDFNMILTPCYPFLMSVPLLLNKNILVFYITNSLLITFLFYLLFQMYKEKAWIFLILLLFPLPAIIEPSYNLFLILLVTSIIYLEKKEKNDYLIGFLIGLTILTKQSVGPFLVIPTFVYYYKDIRKILKRFVGCLIPCVVFVLYLLFTKSFYQFLDLCLYGLLDFSNSNGFKVDIFFWMGIVLLIISIICFIRNRKDIKYLYILMFYSITIPLFDYAHVEFFLFVLCLGLIDKIKKAPKTLAFNCILFSVSISIILFTCSCIKAESDISFPNKYHNFNFRLMYSNADFIRDSVIQFVEENDDKNIIFIGSDAYFYKITCDRDIDYFDLNNYGNHGYHGTEKMKKKIDELEKGTLIIVDINHVMKEPGLRDQLNIEIAKYAMKKATFKESITAYDVYEIQ